MSGLYEKYTVTAEEAKALYEGRPDLLDRAPEDWNAYTWEYWDGDWMEAYPSYLQGTPRTEAGQALSRTTPGGIVADFLGVAR